MVSSDSLSIWPLLRPAPDLGLKGAARAPAALSLSNRSSSKMDAIHTGGSADPPGDRLRETAQIKACFVSIRKICISMSQAYSAGMLE